jgi:hypothetical protein
MKYTIRLKLADINYNASSLYLWRFAVCKSYRISRLTIVEQHVCNAGMFLLFLVFLLVLRLGLTTNDYPTGNRLAIVGVNLELCTFFLI